MMTDWRDLAEAITLMNCLPVSEISALQKSILEKGSGNLCNQHWLWSPCWKLCSVLQTGSKQNALGCPQAYRRRSNLWACRCRKRKYGTYSTVRRYICWYRETSSKGGQLARLKSLNYALIFPENILLTLFFISMNTIFTSFRICENSYK